MRQLVHKLANGRQQVIEVPQPVVSRGAVLVRVSHSLISAGTEKSTVAAARKSLVGKAKERPQQVRQVLDVLRQQGPVQTYRAVTKKLDAYSPLGYSCAGRVTEVGHGVKGFAVGDKVACGGGSYAVHAELVSIPENLCVKLPANANFRSAAYNTLGAIALQGIRQADLKLGETCAVIGLGLLGQLTCLMLRASGVRVVGVDVDPHMVAIAREHCADIAFERSSLGIAERIGNATGGLGVDGVIITAGTNSLDPINFAGELARKKGVVVVVGSVPTGFDREPFYYKKELQVRMSCSYGPGRYDPAYEEKGRDYPAAYVRWTENRNMQAFQELVYAGNIDVGYLTTHEYSLEDAPKAYDMILQNSEPCLGILIKYDAERELKPEKLVINARTAVGKVGIAFIGAGSYAQSNLLPNMPKGGTISRIGVMTATGTTSRRVAEKFGFQFCTSDERDILQNRDINTVFVATRHDSHAEYVLKALDERKNVFVEKPLALNSEQLQKIEKTYALLNNRNSAPPLLMVGFNRRFSPLARFLRESMGGGPMAMMYRVNAGGVSADSWIQDMEIGGGRIIGEACHFIDFLTFMCGSLPRTVYASALEDPNNHDDTVNITLGYQDGSTGTIAYYANGSRAVPKEYVEIYRDGVVGILKDFREVEIYERTRSRRKKLLSQDKGQRDMVSAFLAAVATGQGAPICPAEVFRVSQASIGAVESLKVGQAVSMQDG